MTPEILALLAGGAVLLIAGAEFLVRGASRLARLAGISPLVVGLTVVAFGTSAPELAVTVGAALGGASDVAIGNVVGSNIMNILFILGLSALIAPLIVAQQLVRLDVPLLIGASILVLLMGLDGSIDTVDGLILFGGVVVYTTFLLIQSRRENGPIREEYAEAFGGPAAPPSRASWPVNLGFVAGGLILLVLGARWLVDGAVAAATAAGVSELVIGLTVVAFGTSLPEVATSVLASLRGERDIAVGNIIGSSLFNLLAVLGLGGILAPGGIGVPTGTLTFDIPIMIAVAVAALPILFTGWTIARWEGLLFLGYYGAYLTYLGLQASHHNALDGFATAMLFFVIPLTAITLAILVVRNLRGRRGARAEG